MNLSPPREGTVLTILSRRTFAMITKQPIGKRPKGPGSSWKRRRTLKLTPAYPIGPLGSFCTKPLQS